MTGSFEYGNEPYFPQEALCFLENMSDYIIKKSQYAQLQKYTEVWVLFDNNELYFSLLTQIVLMMKITIHYYKYFNTVGCLTTKK